MAGLRPKVRADLVVIEVDSEAVVYDPEEVMLHHLNPTAAVVFKLCAGSGTVRELSEDIAAVLGASVNTVMRQVRHVVGQFKQAGFIEGYIPKPTPHAHTHAHADSHTDSPPDAMEVPPHGRSA